MKILFIAVMLISSMYSAFAQTIVWKELASLPEGYYLGDAVSLDNEIYFVAGRTDKAKVAFFYKFNPQANQWIKLANIPSATFNLGLAAVNGKIYAIGGDVFQDTNREYDPQIDTWKILEPMPTSRQHIDCGVYGDEIYIMGGLTSWESITRKHEAYNVLSNSWSEKADIPSLRNNAAVVSLDNLIYVIGGAGTEEDIWGDILTVETYYVNTDEWLQKNDLPLLLFKPAATVVNGQIFVLGGQTLIDGKNDCSDKVLIYKSETDSWVETTPMPAKNVFFGCVSIENKIYVIGGTVAGNPNWDAYSAVYEGEVFNDNSK
jgi:N-acetylneuraminic acid mutarotase